MAMLRKMDNGLMDVEIMPGLGKCDREAIRDARRVICNIARKVVTREKKFNFYWAWMRVDGNVVFVALRLIQWVLDTLYRNFNSCTLVVNLTYKNDCGIFAVLGNNWIIYKHLS
jgi:hypothetical protein